MLVRKTYYSLKPFLPVWLQIQLRRYLLLSKKRRHADVWPIDASAGRLPAGWRGWPENKKFALVLTHDVESAKGLANCEKLMALEKKRGFRSSFNFVPEGYTVPRELRKRLHSHGFEVGVHGLTHDGKLYSSRKVFEQRAVQINRYLKEWDVIGFRSPAMHHELEWIHDLDIEYDASTFDTDPFEPQPDGVGTIFPFSVNLVSHKKPYIELPYTLPQDSTLFIFLKEKTIDIWARKLEWIVQKGGMALVITHPDYMNFNNTNSCLKEYPVQLYEQFLNHITSQYEGQYWHVLPKEMAFFWKGLAKEHADNPR